MARSNVSSQREQAYHALRRLLVLQKIPEGERLREPQWAGELGVNRTALREAFARLEAEGMITRGGRTGYVVPKLSEADIEEIRRVRLVLECAAVEDICLNKQRAAACAAALKKVCEEFEKMLKDRYLLGTSEADRRFHETLIDGAGNSRLSLLYHRAPLPMIHGKLRAADHWLAECETTLEEHRAITAAVRKSDAAKAKAALSKHLEFRYLLPMSW